MVNYGKQLWVGSKEKFPLEESKFTKVSNGGNIGIKGANGLWTSSFIDEKYGSAWVQWCLGNDFHVPMDNVYTGYILTPKKKLKLYMVDSLADMHNLFDKYGYQQLPTLQQEAIDFELMSKDYDGLHLTSHGEIITRHGNMFSIGVKEKDLKPKWKAKTMRNLYGYDCESTLHFHWNFESMEEVEINARSITSDKIEALLGNKE